MALTLVASRHTVPGRALSDRERVRQLILNFITAHYNWERAAYDQWESTDTAYEQDGVTYESEQGEKLAASISKSYDDALSPFVASSVGLRCGGWGIPLKHHPEYERVLSVHKRGNKYVVRTKLKRDLAGVTMTDSYEYHVVFEDGDLKIARLLCVLDDTSFDAL